MTAIAPPVVCIVNPASAGGRTGTRWAELQARLKSRIRTHIDRHFTQGPEHAVTLVRESLAAGARTILSVGGDGTINECLNGFLTPEGRPHREDAVFGVVMSGTGGDFLRSHGIARTPEGSIDHLAKARRRHVDVGRLTYETDTGEQVTRLFANIASFGLSGVVDRRINASRWTKRLGGKLGFYYESLMAILRWRNQKVRLSLDGAPPFEANISTVAVSNGRFFGGGMMVAPMADPADGFLDVVLMRDTRLRELLFKIGDIYAGRHMDDPKVFHYRVRSLEVTPAPGEGPVLIDMDGEAPGRLPARFDILPGALPFLG